MNDDMDNPFEGMSPEDMIKQILPDQVFNDNMDTVVARIRDRINQGGVNFVEPHMCVGVFVPSDDPNDENPKIQLIYRELKDIPSGQGEVEAFFAQTGQELFEAGAGLPAFVFVVRPAIVQEGSYEQHDGEEFMVPGKEHKTIMVTGMTVDQRKAFTMVFVDQNPGDKSLFIENEVRTGCNEKGADQTPTGAEDCFMAGFMERVMADTFASVMNKNPELANQVRKSIKERLFGDLLQPDYNPEATIKAGLTDLVSTRLN